MTYDEIKHWNKLADECDEYILNFLNPGYSKEFNQEMESLETNLTVDNLRKCLDE